MSIMLEKPTLKFSGFNTKVYAKLSILCNIPDDFRKYISTHLLSYDVVMMTNEKGWNLNMRLQREKKLNI